MKQSVQESIAPQTTTERNQTRVRRKVAVVYHFFAHYRSAVMKELVHSPCHDYSLAGDRRDTAANIQPWDIPDSVPFIHTPTRYLRGSNIMLQKGLVRLALSRKFDTIIFLGNAYYPSTWMAAAVARLCGKRVLFWTIGWMGRDTGFKRVFRNTFYKLAHGLLLYGHYAKMIALEEGFAPEKLYVIYNSLDYEAQKQIRQSIKPERTAEIRRELFADPHRPLLICTTTLLAKRRLDLLMEAMVILRQQGQELNLLLVGDGPEREKLQRMAEEKKLAVHFYGACYDDKVLGELIMASNAMVAPGMVGLAAMHSLAFGTPVVTQDNPDTQAPEWESLVDGRTGSFFKLNDVNGLARAIAQWTQSELPLESVREACHAMIDRFYNPRFQRIVIDRAVSGLPADDIFFLKPGGLPTDESPCP